MPNVYIIGGPNGAGKTTVALRLFPDILATREFVNADFIARGLSAFNTESVAFAAGRLMLGRIHELKSQQKDFALESTLASRSFVSFLKECKRDLYTVTLIYVGIEGTKLAIERIRERVKQGGHSVPDDVVERRYRRSVWNFWNLYKPLADELRMYDNTFPDPLLVAHKERDGELLIDLPERIERIMNKEIHEPKVEYTANKIDLAVKAAVAEELDRKRKLGLPIVFGRDGKIVVMVGDKVVKEIPYGEGEKELMGLKK